MGAAPRLADTLDFAHVTAEAAGRAILPHFRVAIDVENKDRAGGYDPVTVADRAAETVIRDAIRVRFPTHGLFGEEHGREAGSESWTWVIDPIDGTKSFVLGQLHWGVLIALNDGTRPVLGVAYQPFVGEAFVGRAGGTSRVATRQRAPAALHAPLRAARRRARRHHRSALLRAAARGRGLRARLPKARASPATAATSIATRSSRWASSTS